jgi:glycine/D-amino acid oxidase-like deaminating enzyme
MEVAIVGGGVFGLAAALELAARGHRVRLHEADAALPAARAASNDVSKAWRRIYGAATTTWAPRALDAIARWRSLERRTGRRFVHDTGYLAVATTFAPGGFEFDGAAALARLGGPTVEVLAPAAARARFPLFATPDGATALFDPQSGWLDPVEAVRALAQAAAAAGAEIRTAVRIADPAALRADAVLIAAGAWMTKVLGAHAPPATPTLQIERLHRVRAGTRASAPLPFWSFDIATAGFYGFGGFGERVSDLVKVARHFPGPAVDPDAERIPPADEVARSDAFVARYLPGLEPAAAETRTCLYTMSPDGEFVFDAVPGRPGLFVAGCGSGHAFKFGPLLGVWAADAIEGRSVPREFRIGARAAGRVV